MNIEGIWFALGFLFLDWYLLFSHSFCWGGGVIGELYGGVKMSND